VTRAAAGRGAVREVCDLVMRAKNALEPALRKYLA
jgi:3-deoxy-D-manno-octulosonate 8-phosphate phosphatase (KDO 8-P phosphatase)